jgi:SAM-dependent methyltransferase
VKRLSTAEYAAIKPDNRNHYGAPFFKFTECDHGPAAKLFGRVLWELFRPASVVEFGCGTGGTLGELHRMGSAVSGLEPNRAAWPFAMRNGVPAPDLAEQGFGSVAFRAGPADLTICIEVLEHLPPEDASAAVETIARAAPWAVVTACPPVGRNSLHLNEQPFPYWVDLFDQAGMELHEEETRAIRDIMRGYSRTGVVPVVPGWYYGSYIGVFRRRP